MVAPGWPFSFYTRIKVISARAILGDPGAATLGELVGTIVVKVYCKIDKRPWAVTLTKPLPEAFELPASDCFWLLFWLISERAVAG